MTLIQLFTAIANQIRRLKNKSGTIKAEDFPDEMAEIELGNLTDEEYEEAIDDLDDILENTTVPSGTMSITENGTYNVTNYTTANVKVSGASASPKDVNFYDYDGTIIEAYTKNEFLALESMPDNPSHRGLTAQGWNWTLADAKTYVTNHGKLNIGQMYITDDGKTRLYIHIDTKERMNISLCFKQSVTNGIEVDWGDESSIETFAGAGNNRNILPVHQYSSPGDYVITLNPLDDCQLTLGSNTNNYMIMGATGNSTAANMNKIYQKMLIKAEIGKNVTSISQYAFGNCSLLNNITIPDSITNIETYAFPNCNLLKNVIIPNRVTNIGNYAFYSCIDLRNIIIPNSVTSIGENAFYACPLTNILILPDSVTSIGNMAFISCGLTEVIMPNNLTSIENNTFNSCNNLKNIIIPNGVTNLGNYTFYSCHALSKISIPNGVTNLGAQVFQNCFGLAICDFSTHTQIPTLSNINSFSNIPTDCKIIVPDDLYNDWIVAQNWSTYANYIVKASEA